MNATDLKKILAAHAEWVRGAGGERANLSGANLSGADLSSANLRSANLRSANLSSANLSGANLSGANLSGADLSSANLRSANLRSANLRSANLSGAYLSSAYLSSAEPDDKTIWPAFFVCPDSGAFTAWKKLAGNIIAELLIPAEAKRTSSLIGRKCRAEFAQVVALHGTTKTEAPGIYDSALIYRVGEIVRPDSYDDSILVECSNGIHFLITRKEAEDYA